MKLLLPKKLIHFSLFETKRFSSFEYGNEMVVFVWCIVEIPAEANCPFSLIVYNYQHSKLDE